MHKVNSKSILQSQNFWIKRVFTSTAKYIASQPDGNVHPSSNDNYRIFIQDTLSTQWR